MQQTRRLQAGAGRESGKNYEPFPKSNKTYRSFDELNKAMMQQHLMEQLWAYVIINHPQLMVELKAGQSVTSYLEAKVYAVQPLMERLVLGGKPSYVVTELCMNELTADLGASRFRYLRYILETEFADTYEQYQKEGTLWYETINLVSALAHVFDGLQFDGENAYEEEVWDEVVYCVKQYMAQRSAQPQNEPGHAR